MFYEIQTEKDIEEFLDKTNALHDGIILNVRYSNTGIAKAKGGGYNLDPTKTKLTLQILVTSIWDAVVEMEFEDISEWQLQCAPYHADEIQEASVKIEERPYKRIIWAESFWTTKEDLEGGSYVIAQTMRWRFADGYFL